MKKRNKNLQLNTQYIRLMIIILLLVGASLACNTPSGESSESTSGENLGEVSIATAVAQTMAAKAENSDTPLIPSTEIPIATDTPLPTATDTPLPTETPTPGPTDTPTPTPTNTFTPTPDVPMVQVSVSTNCRQGPGKVYDKLGALLVGEEAEVVAKDPEGSYWYIRNPDKSGGFCWLWGNYATTVGDTASLPVYTPEPTPTPSLGFTASFHNVEVCGNWYIEFSIANTGGITLQSVSTTVTDNNTAQTVHYSNDNFIGGDGCSVSSNQQDLVAGEAGNTLSGWLNNNPAGHNLSATITACTENGLGGTCVTQNLTFTP